MIMHEGRLMNDYTIFCLAWYLMGTCWERSSVLCLGRAPWEPTVSFARQILCLSAMAWTFPPLTVLLTAVILQPKTRPLRMFRGIVRIGDFGTLTETKYRSAEPRLEHHALVERVETWPSSKVIPVLLNSATTYPHRRTRLTFDGCDAI